MSDKFVKEFSEITHRHGCSSVNFVHIFRTPFPENASGGMFLNNKRSIQDFFNHLRSFFVKKNVLLIVIFIFNIIY